MRGSRLLIEHLKRHLSAYILAVFIMAVANVIQAFYPMVLKHFTDDLEKEILTRTTIIDYALILLAIGVGYGVLFGVGQYLNHRLGRFFEFHIRQKLFRHFTKLSEAYFSKNGIGKLLSYVMNDVTTVRESIANSVNQLTSALVLLVTVIIMLAWSGIPLTFIGICIVPLLTIPFLVVYFGPRIRGRSRQVQESLASMTESAEEQFGGIRVTKTFAIESIAQDRFGHTVNRILDNQLKLVRMTSIFQAVLPFVGGLSLVIAITYGGYLTVQNQLSIGDFVAVTLYLRMIVQPLQQIGNVINTMQRARASVDRLNQLLAVKPDIVEQTNASAIDKRYTGMEIRGLTFTYPESNEPSLQDVNLQFERGQTIGIVGKTGSGKTTLVKLLLRVYDPPRGTIFIGGKDILDLELSSLRTQIAYVPQEGFLFSTTIRDNIAFSDRGMGDELVEEAARAAEIYNNIDELPERFATKLGERGLTLSGGQRQRTSLARGMIKDAPILLLDDSVSAVDALTETNIIANLRKVRKGKTTLLIAHRISALTHADHIVVMEEGRVAEQGTHEQLLAQGGYYASLCKLQGEGIS